MYLIILGNFFEINDFLDLSIKHAIPTNFPQNFATFYNFEGELTTERGAIP